MWLSNAFSGASFSRIAPARHLTVRSLVTYLIGEFDSLDSRFRSLRGWPASRRFSKVFFQKSKLKCTPSVAYPVPRFHWLAFLISLNHFSARLYLFKEGSWGAGRAIDKCVTFQKTLTKIDRATPWLVVLQNEQQRYCYAPLSAFKSHSSVCLIHYRYW